MALYRAILRAYADRYGRTAPRQLETEAGKWAITDASRSERVALQFIQYLAARLGKELT